MFRAEIRVHRRRELVALAVALVGPSGAEDVVSAAISRALATPGWSEVDNQHAYLYRAVINEAKNSLRSANRRLAREIRAAQREDIYLEPADIDVLRALKKLRLRERTVIFLRYWEDMTVRDIANVLEVSTRSVERCLHSGQSQIERTLRSNE